MSRSYSASQNAEQFHPGLSMFGQEEAEDRYQEETDSVVRNIASFLTMSDVASLMSSVADYAQDDEEYGRIQQEESMLAVVSSDDALKMDRSDSWAVGVDMVGDGTDDSEFTWQQQLMAPQTPAFISVSPGATPPGEIPQRLTKTNTDAREDDYEEEDEKMEEILLRRKRRLVQQRLAAAVFSHPQSMRSFCLQAYQTARHILRERRSTHYLALQYPAQEQQQNPETCIEPKSSDAVLPYHRDQQLHQLQPIIRKGRRIKRKKLVSMITDTILNNIPLSVLIDVMEALGEVTLDTTFASFTVGHRTLDALVQNLLHLLSSIWHSITHFNPFQLLEAIVSFQFNAMGKTTEALAGGIQSVATGVGSASSLALHRFSAANLVFAGTVPSTGVETLDAQQQGGDGGGGAARLRRSRSTPGTVINKKLLRKLSTMNEAARVVHYMESPDETGGLTKQARTKVQRMMHYEVSLRPFVATVQAPAATIRTRTPNSSPVNPTPCPSNSPGGDNGTSSPSLTKAQCDGDGSQSSSTDDDNNNNNNNNNSPLMFTPQSFPATPHSRQLVMAQGGRFADDVIFLARDRLRLHGSLESDNERTREMAKLLREGKRLAVFNARDASSGGIELSCGQHIATKAGNMLYCTTRSMVPILRNCLVYFEITVLPRSFGNMALQPSMTTLSIGLSTEEMPPNVLVGAWQGSCGLCTTGQIFVGGEWCAPSDPTIAAYRDGATIGCLVYLDDASAVDTWEGILVNATITFNVNGLLVAPVISSSSMLAGPFQPPQQSLPNPVMSYMARGQAMNSNSTVSLDEEDLGRSSPHSSFGDRPFVTLSMKVPAAEELYPTVTLHSPATSVMCRFSAEDVVASSRETIGAPMGSTVYSIDGSVVFE